MLRYCIKKAVKKLIVVALLASSLNACSLPQVKPTDTLEPNKGLVIVRIVNNVDFLNSPFPFDTNWQSLRISETKEEGRSFNLSQAHLATTRSTQIFSAQLPEGTYRLETLIVAGGKRYYTLTYKSWVPLDKLGIFKVVPRHITNLGTIIYQPIDGNRYQLIHANIDAELHEMIANNYPVINKIAAGKKMIGWDNESILENTFIAPSDYLNNLESRVTQKNILNKSAALSFAKANSAGFNNPRQISSGEIFAGSKLGQVLVKERDGKWTQLDTGFTREITAVLPIDKKTIFAGGEDGVLLLTNDGGRSWKRVETPLKTSILFLEQVNGRFFIGSRLWSDYLGDRTDLFYETGDILSNNWKAIEAIKPISGFISYPAFASCIANNKLYLFIPGSIIYVFDLTTNSWNMIKTPFGYRSINSFKNGFFYAQGRYNTAYVSHDFGNTWISIDLPSGRFGAVNNPVFINNQNGFVLIFKPVTNNVTLKKTQDGGKSWEEVSDFNDLKLPYPWKLFYDYVNNKLYFAVDGRIYIASDDDFKNWTRVR
jgi:photosystem II stability/assembly factor-like uncharacterized protein